MESVNQQTSFERTNKVLHFDTQAKYKQDLQKILSSLPPLAWEYQVKILNEATGLPLNELSINRSAKIPGSSLAGRLGHTELGEFITGRIEDNGLNIPWNEWHDKVTALRNKEFYGIPGDTPEDITSEFNDVCNILGHVPASKHEYNRAKDTFLIQQRQIMIEKHESDINNFKEQIESAKQNTFKLRTEISEMGTLISNLETEKARIINEVEMKLSVAKEYYQSESVKSLENQRIELEQKYNEQLSSLKNEMENKIIEAEFRIAENEKKFNSESYVPISVHNATNEQLNLERDTNKQLLIRLSESQLKTDQLLKDATNSSEEITQLKKLMSEQSVRIEVLTANLDSGGSASNPIQITEMKNRITELENQLVQFQFYVEKFRHSRNKHKNKSEELQLRIDKMKSALDNYRKMAEGKSKPKSNDGFLGKLLNFLS